jgi:hypothetical protein
MNIVWELEQLAFCFPRFLLLFGSVAFHSYFCLEKCCVCLSEELNEYLSFTLASSCENHVPKSSGSRLLGDASLYFLPLKESLLVRRERNMLNCSHFLVLRSFPSFQERTSVWCLTTTTDVVEGERFLDFHACVPLSLNLRIALLLWEKTSKEIRAFSVLSLQFLLVSESQRRNLQRKQRQKQISVKRPHSSLQEVKNFSSQDALEVAWLRQMTSHVTVHANFTKQEKGSNYRW